jgi:HTH-type transcriptional regulator/antitoxin HigA
MKILDRESYGILLTTYQPQVIESEAVYEGTLQALEALMAKGEALTPEEEAILSLMATLIEQYENQQLETLEMNAVSPQDMLLHLMMVRDLKQADLVSVIGSKGIVSEIVNGKRAISKTQAKNLAEFFHVSPALFI